MIKELTCIICPIGCQLRVNIENDNVISVEGNSCKRGENYAKDECTNPVRVITTTVMTKDGEIVCVKTDKAVPKALIFDCMREINVLHPSKEKTYMGSVICENILNTGANIIVTSSNSGSDFNDK